jgi:hypothetical protein
MYGRGPGSLVGVLLWTLTALPALGWIGDDADAGFFSFPSLLADRDPIPLALAASAASAPDPPAG